MGAREQSRVVPCPAVGMSRQHIRQCLVSTSTVAQRRALRDCRANQRMAEPEGLQIDVNDARLGGTLNDLEIQGCSGNDAGGPEDLGGCITVVECGNQQDQPSCVGQLRHTGRECTLETLSQRQRT